MNGQISGIHIHNPSDSSWVKQIPFGMPHDDDPTNDLLICRHQYVLSYNPQKNAANWVAWQLHSDWYGEVPRHEGNFLTDTLLPDSIYKVKHKNYTNSGYNRGHMVRSEERTATIEDNRSTFFLTNVLPQTPDLNQGVWLDFEYYCEDLCKNANKVLYIYAGGVFSTDSTLKGEGYVAIPDSCFKIVLITDKGSDHLNFTKETIIIAVIMPNSQGIRQDNWEKYTTTIRHIEHSTGYNFFSDVDMEIQEFIETKNRSHY